MEILYQLTFSQKIPCIVAASRILNGVIYEEKLIIPNSFMELLEEIFKSVAINIPEVIEFFEKIAKDIPIFKQLLMQ